MKGTFAFELAESPGSVQMKGTFAFESAESSGLAQMKGIFAFELAESPGAIAPDPPNASCGIIPPAARDPQNTLLLTVFNLPQCRSVQPPELIRCCAGLLAEGGYEVADIAEPDQL